MAKWPLYIFIGLMMLIAIGMGLNSRELGSARVDQQAPSLTAVQTEMQGKVWVLNVWASWCQPCAMEHEHLVAFAKQSDIPLVGLSYKDSVRDARKWLEARGNPYQRVLRDPQGNIGLEWGVVAVPQTFVMNAQGQIKAQHTGPVTLEQLKALVEKAQ